MRKTSVFLNDLIDTSLRNNFAHESVSPRNYLMEALEKMSTSYSIGDIVVLKSGGPKMTVTEVPDDNTVCARWFDGAVLRADGFHTDEINLAGNREYSIDDAMRQYEIGRKHCAETA
jgi:uncharacterized protein YodC (DUF2158 family)